MLAQPRHRFPNSNTERFGTQKPWDEALDFRVVENTGMGFVAFQISSLTRLNATYKIGRDLHDFGTVRSQGVRNFFINLVPTKHLIARNVKCLSYRLLFPDKPGQPNREIACGSHGPGVLPVIWNIN